MNKVVGGLVSVSATMDIGYIGIRQISAKINGYRPKYRHISAKIPVIGQISANMKISVSGADMLVLIYLYRYRHKYRLGEYIGIIIGWTHIGPTLCEGQVCYLGENISRNGKRGGIGWQEIMVCNGYGRIKQG